MAGARYDRQRRLSQIGEAGQKRIQEATVAVVGCGALGSVSAELLARAGVGHLILIDRDIVQWSNLQRQVLYTERDARHGYAKADAAARHLRRINSSIQLTSHVVELAPENVLNLLGAADLWIDGSDNFEVRLLINDAALKLGRPWIHGGCVGVHGQVSLFWPGKTICFRCLVPQVPPVGTTETCETAGVLGPATAAIASLQVAQALRLLADFQEHAPQELYALDVWSPTFRTVKTNRAIRADCPACQLGEYEYLDRRVGSIPTVLCGQRAVQFSPPLGDPPDFDRVSSQWKGSGDIQRNRFFIRWRSDLLTLTLFRDGRIVVEGTEDIAAARSAVHQLLGG